MEITILDKSLNAVYIVDSYQSIIWTSRYYEPGDFELYIPASEEILPYVQKDYYVTRDDDDTVMVIERIEIKTDIEDGDFYIISGHSLESILQRRIIWTQTNLSTNDPVDGINQLITQNAISPSTAARAIPNLELGESTSISGTLNVQFTGTNLGDAITSICRQFAIGFRIRIVDGKFQCSCHQGQEVDVIFSPEFDNLVNSDYIFDCEKYKNCALVAGEGEGTSRIRTSVYSVSPVPEGLDRYEMYIDARDINSNNGEISMMQYLEKLGQRGYQKLAENEATVDFENEILPNVTYSYREDYNLGDIVTVMNGHGINIKPRITEIIESWDDTGYKIIPTFEEV